MYEEKCVKVCVKRIYNKYKEGVETIKSMQN